jgi:hypothetical protein
MRCIYYKPTHWTQASAPSVINEYAFEFKPGYRPFQIRKVDEGFNGWGTFSGGTTRARFFAGVDEEPWPDPVLLDGAGKPIDANFSVGQISGGKTTLISPIQNPGATGAPPHYPPWAELDPNSPAGSKILIFTRKRTNSFNGLIPGVM